MTAGFGFCLHVWLISTCSRLTSMISSIFLESRLNSDLLVSTRAFIKEQTCWVIFPLHNSMFYCWVTARGTIFWWATPFVWSARPAYCWWRKSQPISRWLRSAHIVNRFPIFSEGRRNRRWGRPWVSQSVTSARQGSSCRICWWKERLRFQ